MDFVLLIMDVCVIRGTIILHKVTKDLENGGALCMKFVENQCSPVFYVFSLIGPVH